jgi:hypothetical protein
MFVDVMAAPDLTPLMRTTILCAALLLVLSLTGCFWRRERTQAHFAPVGVSDSPTNAPDTNNVFTITPAQGPNGHIASVNANLNFAVVTFPIGQMAQKDSLLYVYRNGNKAAELKVTGPQQDDNTVADIVSGVALPGDEVREK